MVLLHITLVVQVDFAGDHWRAVIMQSSDTLHDDQANNKMIKTHAACLQRK